MRIVVENRKISLRNFQFGFTYESVLEGVPDEEINKIILENIKPPTSWGFFNHFTITVSEEQMKSELPKCYYHALLISDPLTDDSCASGLLLTWFGEAPGTRSIQMITKRALEQIVWEICAKDFDF